jgi:hypothetical protein
MRDDFDLVLQVAKFGRTKNKGQLVSALYKVFTDGIARATMYNHPHELGRAKIEQHAKAQTLVDRWYTELPSEFKSMNVFSNPTANWGSRKAIKFFREDFDSVDFPVSNILLSAIKEGHISKDLRNQMSLVAHSLREIQSVDFEQYRFIFNILGINSPGILHLISFIKFFTNKLYWTAYEEVNKRNPDYQKLVGVRDTFLEEVKAGKIKSNFSGGFRKVYFIDEYVIKQEPSIMGGQHSNECALWVNRPYERLCPIEYMDHANRIIIMKRGEVARDIEDINEYYDADFEHPMHYGKGAKVWEIGDESNWAWFDGVPLIIDYGASDF